MVKVPEDLYPNANLIDKLQIVDEYIRFSCESLKRYFQDRDSLISYVEAFEDHRDAEDFIYTGRYLYKMHKLNDPSVKLLLFIALIERLTVKNYLTITAWVQKLDNELDAILKSLATCETERKKVLKKELEKLAEEYYEKYGARNNFANFVEKYVSREDQFKLILTFRINYTDVVGRYTQRWDWLPKVNHIGELKQQGFEAEKSLMPKCYEWKMCFVDYGSCRPEEGCLVRENEDKWKQTLRSVAKKIYDMRSEIAHKASDKPLPEATGEENYVDILLLIDGKPVSVQMSINEFERIFVDALKRYFDSRPRK